MKEGEEPEIYTSDNLDRDILEMLTQNYRLIGEASFNGPYEGFRNISRKAESVGATVVLVSSNYTNTRTVSGTYVVPNTTTTYHSGSFTGSNYYSGQTYGSFSGTSTSYGTSRVPYSYQIDKYDQSGVFFAKSISEPIIGIVFTDLTPEDRTRIKRNTGAIVFVVVKDSQAFNMNVLPGDVIISINDKEVRGRQDSMEMLDNTFASRAEYVDFEFWREGEIIKMRFKL